MGIELFRGLRIKVKSVGGGVTRNMYWDGKIEGDSQQLSREVEIRRPFDFPRIRSYLRRVFSFWGIEKYYK